jgi:hypothetical protein
VWSSVIADPSVEIVVVGDELVDDEADVDRLPDWQRCKGPIESSSKQLLGPFWTIVCCEWRDVGEQPDISTSISNIDTNDGTVGELDVPVPVLVIIVGAVGDLQKG